MRSPAISCLSVVGAAGALALPAAASAATTSVPTPAATASAVVGGTVPTPARPLPKSHELLIRLAHERKAPFVRRDVRLGKRLAHVRGTHVKHHYARTLRAWPLHDLERHARLLRHTIVRTRRAKRRAERAAERARRAAQQRAGAVSPALQAIAQCESGGNPRAIGGGGQFRGKYQFTYSTWAAVGGHGDPAAAPEAEQDARAARLYAIAGPGQWPVCGR